MSSNKLALKKLTIRKLTTDEQELVVGGLPGGVAVNPTGGDTKGVWYAAKWYANKFTIGNGG